MRTQTQADHGIKNLRSMPRSTALPTSLPGNSPNCRTVRRIRDVSRANSIRAIRRSTQSSLLLAKKSAEQEDDLPREERAEAKGCEHTAVESFEEDKMFKQASRRRQCPNFHSDHIVATIVKVIRVQ